jgi:transcriptional regulator with XRE-family HTH domain
MKKSMFEFNKEMRQILIRLRKQAGLSQGEIAKRIGTSAKYGPSYISRIENGKIKNPFLKTILLYIRSCGVRYSTFFDEVAKLELNSEHNKIRSEAMAKTGMQYSNGFTLKTYKQIDRERFKYDLDIKQHRNKAKSLSVDSFQKAGIEFAQHRKLCELVVGEIRFLAYKLCSRECYKMLRKYYMRIKPPFSADEIKKNLIAKSGRFK